MVAGRIDNSTADGGRLAVAVDLDGTLLRGNSFRLYVRAGLRSLWRRRRYSALAGLLLHAALRRARLSSHRRFKQRCARAIGFGDDVLGTMRRSMQHEISPAVQNFIDDKRRQGYDIILATAAFADYIPAVWDGDFVATAYKRGQAMRECRGDEKLSRLLMALDKRGLTLRYVLTDHPDDMPLLRHNAAAGGVNVIVNPTPRNLSFFRQLEPTQLGRVELLRDHGIAPGLGRDVVR